MTIPATPVGTLAERVAQAIALRPCSQSDLAAAAKVTPPSVSDWLSGKTRQLTAGPALRAAHFLGVNALWLAEGVGPMTPDSPVPDGIYWPVELSASERFFLESVVTALDSHAVPPHALQTVLMILDACPPK